jgi:hypothetical protein
VNTDLDDRDYRMLLLGPMPDAVALVVRRLVAEAQAGPCNTDERLNGYMLTGGPSGACYLDADGNVWNKWWSLDASQDGAIELVPDGPLKVGLVAIGAWHVPDLAAWLPSRPNDATNCALCQGSGWLPQLQSRVQCFECHGLGWIGKRTD